MESTPQVANANRIENTATMTIRLDDSALEGSVTLCLNSSMDSLIYVTMLCYFTLYPEKPLCSFPHYFGLKPFVRLRCSWLLLYFLHGRRDFPWLRTGQASRLTGLFPFFSTGGETRTPDTWFWRPVLYQLSYTRI